MPDTVWTLQRLLTLINRGDRIAVTRGRLVVVPASGRVVPDAWLADNAAGIIAVIGAAAGIAVLRYEQYAISTRRFHGVQLIFSDLTNHWQGAGETFPAAFFNAVTTRQRTTAAGQAGDPLPKNHFSITLTPGKQPPAFWLFWERTGLAHPQRPSRYHKKMALLREQFFTADIHTTSTIKRKILNETLTPISMSATEINDAVNRYCGYKPGPTQVQGGYKAGTTTGYSDSQPDQQQCGLQAIQPTGHLPTEHSYTETQVNSTHEQAISNAEKGGSGNRPPATQTTDEWLLDYESGKFA
ncbi:MAG: hypothetical protein CMI00_13745 [Oceanospirillaceae bacterium]|nr:hypothetical protein [Oceanospirillaceae bacterium]|tara:strand:- start:3336 stop:4229 length:894 start_codon:yes stop_codon:yes gene_type:complete